MILTLSINVWWLIALLALIGWPVFYIIRYYILAQHTRLPQVIVQQPESSEPPQKEPAVMHPNRFLPEEIFATFLSQIKIFNYLDRGVLIEFARNSQQKKLYQGEYIHLDQGRKELYLVMDGTVELEMDQDLILNQVSTGGSISSLFDILSVYAQGLDIEASAVQSPLSNLRVRATEETTLLMIPPEAFIRVSKIYPTATTQIIQIILTRFQRVSMLVLGRWLGVGMELIKMEGCVYGEEEEEIRGRSGYDMHLQQKEGFVGESNQTELVQALSHVVNKRRLRSLATVVQADKEERQRSSSESSAPDKRVDLVMKRSPSSASMYQSATDHSRHKRSSSVQLDNRFSMVQKSVEHLAGIDKEGAMSSEQLKDVVYDSIGTVLGLTAAINDTFTFIPPTRARFDSVPQSASSSVQRRKEDINSPAGSISNVSLHSTPMITQEMKKDVQILYYEEGSTVIKQGDRNVGLFFVIDGLLEVSMSSQQAGLKRMGSQYASKSGGLHKHTSSYTESGSQSVETYFIHRGGVAGYLASLTGHPSLVTVRARNDTLIGYISKKHIDSLLEKYPQVLMMLSKRLCDNLSPLVREVDLSLEWIQVNAGKVLYRQDDPNSECIYIVLNGRLRAVEGPSKRVVGEYSLGESVGELEVLTNTPRASTVSAIRDTELARMPNTLFNALAMRHPNINMQISKMIATKSQQYYKQQNQLGPINVNYKTVALLPASPEIPIMEFGERLKQSLTSIGESTMFLDSATVTQALGRHAFSRIGKLKLLTWLTEQEERMRLVLYVADTGPQSAWTQRCIRQADCILVVGAAHLDPSIGEVEKVLLSVKTTARKELVILHNDRNIVKGSTRKWLDKRPWIQMHHHLQIPMSLSHQVIKRKNALFEDLKSHFEKIYSKFANAQRSFAPKNAGTRTDFARLGRRLVGKSIGLALGGGGARGIAHIGVIHAFEEAGIPIDSVGGVSIGALIGGLYSLNEDIYYVYWRASDFGSRVSSIWRQLLDLTYPVASWFSGQEFNRSISKCFNGDQQIEDAWLNYFCCTTNITTSKLEIHTRGYFWRYVRASMSLSGYLPPITDNGNLLLDGGYLNNLPADILRAQGSETIIAIDVASDEAAMVHHYGDSLSGWLALFSQLWPFSKSSYPTLTDIQSRLAYVSCVKQLEDVKNMENCIYLRPPVGHFGTLQFDKFDQIYDIGYKYGKEVLKEWELKGMFTEWKRLHDKPRSRARRNSI